MENWILTLRLAQPLATHVDGRKVSYQKLTDEKTSENWLRWEMMFASLVA
jgi:hypothetical protein